MCGIAGIYVLSGAPVEIRTARRLADILRHRGPDDEGFALIDTAHATTWQFGGPESPSDLPLPRIEHQTALAPVNLVLAHRRLAIIDTTPAGHGPMSSADGSLCITYNGEVYNYLELRAELRDKGHTFRTMTDTEVILHAYAEWGIDCVSHFNGMWAFTLWDHRRRLLFAARDRMGVKPYYYSWDGRRFTFASEMKALWRSGAVPAAPDPAAVALYIAGHGRTHSAATMLQNIRQLPPAHTLILTPDGTLTIRRYWQLEVNEELGDGQPRDGVVDRFRELLIDGVRLRLRADVAIGTCLSGGIDSSAIVCAAHQLMVTDHVVRPELIGEHQKTFSACYENSSADERYFIDQVVARTGAEPHYVFPDAEGLEQDLERLVYDQDEPFVSTSIYAQWCVMRRVQEAGVRVSLDGQGADELLGGYTPYAAFLGQTFRTRGVGQALRALREIRAVKRTPYRELLATGARGLMPPALRHGLRIRLRPVADSGLRPEFHRMVADRQEAAEHQAEYTNLNRLLRDQELTMLPTLLHYEDRNSMAHSVEARTPFVDYRLVEFTFQQPAAYKVYRGWTKWILRAAIASLVPAEIAWRRDKMGFETPEEQWIGQMNLPGKICHAGSPAMEYLDGSLIRSVAGLGRGALNRRTTRQMWRWLNIAVWLRQLAEGPTP